MEAFTRTDGFYPALPILAAFLFSISRTESVLRAASFVLLVAALCVGAVIIIGAMLRGRRAVASPAPPLVASE